VTRRTVCVFGGTGFVGRALAARLMQVGHDVRIPTRRLDRHKDLLVLPTVSLRPGDVYDPGFIRQVVAGCDAVINLVGVLNEGRGVSFAAAHVALPEKIVAACQEQGVPRLLHMSALNAAVSAPSRYLRTKAAGEEVVRASDLNVTIFRPSVIFGPHDGFLNRFAKLLRLSPGVFPLACPDARFQPVYVEDVARAFVQALDAYRTHGQAYALCGPRVYTLREIVSYLARLLRLHRRIVGLNDTLSRWQATVAEFLPGKPFSRDNYASLKLDSVCDGQNALTDVFGIRPTPLEEIAPGYLVPAIRRRANAA